MNSICIITYNGETYIRQQLDSILPQMADDDEIIVSDDNSYDSTLDIIREYQDTRIKIYQNPQKGVIRNVENALRYAKGDFIFLADQDDVWQNDKMNISLDALKRCDLVVSDCYVTDKDLNITHDSFYEINHSFKNKFLAYLKNPYLGCCMAFHKKILQKALPFPADIPMHDIWLGNVAAFYYTTDLIPDKLIYYRRHGANASTASAPSNKGIKEMIRIRLNIAKKLWKVG